MPRATHFEIEAVKPEQLSEFYEKVFGQRFKKRAGPSDYCMIMTGENEPGMDGGLLRRTQTSKPVNTIDVSSIDEYLKKIKENKEVVLVPKKAILGVGWTALFKDPKDNIFGLMEEDPKAR